MILICFNSLIIVFRTYYVHMSLTVVIEMMICNHAYVSIDSIRAFIMIRRTVARSTIGTWAC
jgi:hypothetical protein